MRQYGMKRIIFFSQRECEGPEKAKGGSDVDLPPAQGTVSCRILASVACTQKVPVRRT
jgi:hypothetical protein